MIDVRLVEAPDYAAAMDSFVREAVHDRMTAMDPIYGQLRRVPFPEGVDRIRVEVVGGNTTSPEVHMTEGIELRRDDILAGHLERLHEVIGQIAESYLPQFMRPFFEYVGDAAASVGNSIDAAGAGLSWDLILDAYEMTEWAIDDGGVVRPPQLVAGPDVIAKYQQLPQPTQEQQQRLRDMTSKKQEEHVSRRRSRRLRRESD